MTGNDDRIRDLLDRQWGLVTDVQAQERGVLPAELAQWSREGSLESVHAGVFLHSEAPLSMLTTLRAAWLSIAPELEASQRALAVGVLSHTTAAYLHDVGDFALQTIEYSAWDDAHATPDGFIRHVTRLTPGDVMWLDGLPCTSVLRTIEDLLRDQQDGGHIGRVLVRSMSRSLVSRGAVVNVLNEFSEFYGLPPGQGDDLLDYFEELAHGR